ncbi:MAG: MFS transporter, partial [Methanobacterium sp.]
TPGTFWLYSIIGISAWVFVYFLVPETKGKSLEEIEMQLRAGKRIQDVENTKIKQK